MVKRSRVVCEPIESLHHFVDNDSLRLIELQRRLPSPETLELAHTGRLLELVNTLLNRARVSRLVNGLRLLKQVLKQLSAESVYELVPLFHLCQQDGELVEAVSDVCLRLLGALLKQVLVHEHLAKLEEPDLALDQVFLSDADLLVELDAHVGHDFEQRLIQRWGYHLFVLRSAVLRHQYGLQGTLEQREVGFVRDTGSGDDLEGLYLQGVHGELRDLVQKCVKLSDPRAQLGHDHWLDNRGRRLLVQTLLADEHGKAVFGLVPAVVIQLGVEVVLRVQQLETRIAVVQPDVPVRQGAEPVSDV